MKALIEYFINRSFVVNLISAFIIISGLILGSMIKRDIIPPFEYKMVNVSVSLPGASATEIEKFLTYPIENALQGLPHAKEVSSRSSAGSLRLEVFFDAGHKTIDESIEQIRARINSIRWQLPEQSRDITVNQVKVDTVFHMGIALENFVETNPEHRQLAKNLADTITAVPGIIQASVEMNAQNVYIKIDPKKIRDYEISIAEIRGRISEALNFSPIGKVDFNEKSFAIEVERPAEALGSLKNLAIRGNRNGNILFLKDIADVSLEIDTIKQHRRFNGNPVINIFTRKDIVHDSITLKKEVQKLIEKENKKLPEPLKAVTFIDGPKFIETQLGTLTNNGIFGLILVLVILTLFFNFRVSLATSFGIPIAYCGTLVALYFLDISIDLISVVGMILVLGILVDDAIIIAERYMENLEEGMTPKDAAFEASRDLMLPVTGTVLTTVFAFLPMVMIASEIAIVFYAIPVVIITSLVMSWLESFFILPNHLFHFIKKPIQQNRRTRAFDKTKQLYVAVLSKILKFRYLVIICLIGFMGASIWVAKNKIQQSFYFNANLERISVNVTLKESGSLEQTEKAIAPIEKHLMALPKDKFGAVTTTIGEMWTKGRFYEGYRFAKVSLYISDEVTHPNSLKIEYTKKLKEELAKFKTDNFESLDVGHEMNDQNELKKDMVTIDLTGKDDVDFLEIKSSIEEEIKQKSFKLEVVQETNEFDDKWIFSPNTQKLAQHQLSQSQLTQQLRSFFVPHELMQVRMYGETKWVYTQVERPQIFAEKELNDMMVLNSRELSVPLKNLGHWYKKRQMATIRHKDGKRMLSFDLAYNPDKDMNVTKAKEQAQSIVSTLAKKYPTYQMELKDADRAEKSSREWAGKVALLCIFLVMFTLALILGSITLPFIVGLPIPFGLMGIIWALYLHDMPMGMMSLIGLVGTVGVSVNDSIVMVDQIIKRGQKLNGLTRDAIIAGASSRLRAIILTTVTTLGGVFPMAYGIGGESGFTQPLAFSIGWGLFFSTFLTLFALPAFIEIRQDFGTAFTWTYSKLTKQKTMDVKTSSTNKKQSSPIIKSQSKLPEFENNEDSSPNL